MNPHRLAGAPAAVVVACALLLGACGGNNDNSSSAGSKPASKPASMPATTSASDGYGAGGYGGGGSASGSTTAAGQKLTLDAEESGGLSFNKKTLTAKAGTVTLTLDNPSSDRMPHAIAIEGNGIDKDGQTAQPGGTSTVTVKLKPGKYTFYCPVPGHEAAGMKGTLTVR